MSRGNYGGTVISEITTGGNGTVQDGIMEIQQRISKLESNTDVQSRATGSIMGGRNEQAALGSRNNNPYNDYLARAVMVKRINSQATTNSYDIDEPEPSTIAINGANFTVL